MKEKEKDFCEWLLDNEGKPEADALLRRMYESSAEGSAALAEQGYAAFAGKVGLKRQHRWHTARRWAMRIAAALLLPVSLLCAFSLKKALEPETEWMHVTTARSESRDLTLSDGTKVRLSPCSQLFYPAEFRGKQRKVILIGEAFLEVEKDPQRQFVVNTSKMDVVVHGTKFNVTAFPEDEEDEVALLEGSVEMRFPGEESSVFLAPGEFVKHNRLNGDVQRRSFSTNYFEEVVAQGGLQFRDARLDDIVQVLTRHFNVNIIIQDPALENERYHASFINNEDVETILEALNTGHLFTVSLQNGIYYITQNS